MQTVAIVIHLMIVATLIATVLLQKSEGGGLGVGGGAGFMSSRGTANLLTRTTAVLAFGFFLTSLFLSWYASFDRKPTSILDNSPASQSGGGPGDARAAAVAGRRHPGFAEESRRATAEPAGAVRSAGAALAIKQGGHAGRRLSSCIQNTHQYIDISLVLTSPTARQNVSLWSAIRFGESRR
jgi:preprotein translocase subunit SecG